MGQRHSDTLRHMPMEPSSFDRAEYDGAVGIPFHCACCGRGIDDLHFEMDNRPVCSTCASRVTAFMPASNRHILIRSAGAGVLAALGASLGYFLFLRILGHMGIASMSVLAAIPVGWMVGKAMRVAARGTGGKRYQWTGALLTYAAIICPLQLLLMGKGEDAWWLYPFVLIRPIAFLFMNLRTIGTLQLFAALVAMRWSWTMLKVPLNPVRCVQPAGE